MVLESVVIWPTTSNGVQLPWLRLNWQSRHVHRLQKQALQTSDVVYSLGNPSYRLDSRLSQCQTTTKHLSQLRLPLMSVTRREAHSVEVLLLPGVRDAANG
jgi:hypothetical protein